jgi:hypothetical protein
MLDAPERTAARSACPAKREGTRRAPHPFEKTKDRQGGLRFLRQNQRRDLRVFIDSQPAQAQECAEKLTLHLLGDSSDEGCADIDRNDLVSLTSLQSETHERLPFC